MIRPSIFFASWVDTRFKPAYDARSTSTGNAMRDDDHSPISSSDAKRLFADWKAAPAIVLAVSGGPDSIAMMWLPRRRGPPPQQRPRPAARPPAPTLGATA